MAVNLDSYSVYDNSTNRVIKEGKYYEVEDYIDDPRYTVVWNLNGMVL